MKKYLIVLLSIILFPSIVLAENGKDREISINIKDSFKTGEVISFDYEITGEKGDSIVYVASYKCDAGAPVPFPEERTAVFGNESVKGSFQGIEIIEELERQQCEAFVEIVGEGQDIARKGFLIDVKSALKADFMLCESEKCDVEKKLFVQGEALYIGFSASSEVDAVAMITAPGMKEEALALPASYNLSKKGEYRIEFIFTQEGYKDAKDYANFNVIGQDEVVSREGQKISSETNYNSKAMTTTKWILLLGIVLIITILGIVLYVIYRRRRAVQKISA